MGERIRRLRDERGWSQHELGIRLGLAEDQARQQVSRWETTRREPRPATLRKMAEAFGVLVAVLNGKRRKP